MVDTGWSDYLETCHWDATRGQLLKERDIDQVWKEPKGQVNPETTLEDLRMSGTALETDLLIISWGRLYKHIEADRYRCSEVCAILLFVSPLNHVFSLDGGKFLINIPDATISLTTHCISTYKTWARSNKERVRVTHANVDIPELLDSHVYIGRAGWENDHH